MTHISLRADLVQAKKTRECSLSVVASLVSRQLAAAPTKPLMIARLHMSRNVLQRIVVPAAFVFGRQPLRYNQRRETREVVMKGSPARRSIASVLAALIWILGPTPV